MTGRTIGVHIAAGLSYLALAVALLIAIAYPIRKVRNCPSPWTKRLVYGLFGLALVLLLVSVVLIFALN